MPASNIQYRNERRGIGILATVVSLYVIARMIFYVTSESFSTTFLDELAAVLLLPVAPLGLALITRTNQGKLVLFLISVYLILILSSSIIYPYSLERGYAPFWQGVLFEIKPFVIFIGLYFLAYRTWIKGNLDFSIKALCVTLISISLLDIPFVISDILTGYDIFGDKLILRGGFFRPNGLFRHPVSNSQQLLFAMIACVTLLRFRFRGYLFILMLVLYVLVIASLQVKESVSATIVLATYPFIGRKLYNGMVPIAAFGLLAALTLVLVAPAQNPITGHLNASLGETEDTVRAVMHSASVELAVDEFPLGSGVSTFGSEGSRRNGYSSLYKKYQIWGLWGATYSNDRYLLDTFWPKVLGESGFVGLAAYLGFVIFALFASFLRLQREMSPTSHFSFLVILSTVIISTATQAFNEELIGPMFFIALSCTILPKVQKSEFTIMSGRGAPA